MTGRFSSSPIALPQQLLERRSTAQAPGASSRRRSTAVASRLARSARCSTSRRRDGSARERRSCFAALQLLRTANPPRRLPPLRRPTPLAPRRGPQTAPFFVSAREMQGLGSKLARCGARRCALFVPVVWRARVAVARRAACQPAPPTAAQRRGSATATPELWRRERPGPAVCRRWRGR